MSIPSLLYRELVMGGHLLALGTSSIAAASALVMGVQPTPVLLIMAYLFSYGAYMMNRTAEMEEDTISNPERTAYLKSRGKYLPVIVGFCFSLGYILAVLVNLVFFTALLMPLVLSVAYSVGSKRLTRLVGAKKLKDRFLVKNLAISFGWSLIPLLVGLYYFRVSSDLLLLSPFIFLRLLVNTILFDVRDVDGDRRSGIRTLPIALGTIQSFRWMTAIDLLSAAYLGLSIAGGLLPSYASVLFSLPAYSLLYRLGAKERSRLNFICDFVADGEYILWGPLLYLAKTFA